MTQTIVLTTGGSGGHIFPAQSVAEELIKRGYDVVFITDKRGNSFQNLPQVKTYHLMAESVTGRSVFGKVVALMKLWFGAAQAMKLLFKLKPALVIGFGGYASIPTVVSAQMMKIPIVLHEQNAVLGRANRIVARKAKVIATSFPKVERIPKNVPSIHVGQPVREPILKRSNTPLSETEEFNLFIFGGSQGAHFFSEHLPEVLMFLPETMRQKIVLTAQARPEDEEMVKKAYANAHFKQLTIQPFFNNMPELLTNAHLVIGRGGAGTLTEAMVVGRPVIVIPLPSAADNHQVANAKQVEAAGAGWVIEQKDFDAEKFAKKLKELIENRELLKKTAEKAYAMAILNAAERMADIVDDLLKGKGKNG